MSLRNKIFTVIRRGAGDYDANGFFKKTNPDTSFQIKASIHPVSGSETLLLPENRREKDLKKLITSTELFSVEKGEGTNNDLLIVEGKEYEVFKVKKWDNSIINHYEVYVSKITANDNLPSS